jgi:hypothetical protein
VEHVAGREGVDHRDRKRRLVAEPAVLAPPDALLAAGDREPRLGAAAEPLEPLGDVVGAGEAEERLAREGDVARGLDEDRDARLRHDLKIDDPRQAAGFGGGERRLDRRQPAHVAQQRVGGGQPLERQPVRVGEQAPVEVVDDLAVAARVEQHGRDRRGQPGDPAHASDVDPPVGELAHDLVADRIGADPAPQHALATRHDAGLYTGAGRGPCWRPERGNCPWASASSSSIQTRARRSPRR